MKRVLIYSLLILSLMFFISAVENPSVGVGSEDVDAVGDAVDKIPINPDTGEIDFDKYDKTKSDERIEAINEYIGPITKVLFGVELSLSWIFVFSLIMWILLIEIIVMPVSEIFEFNILGSLVVAGIIATLAMQGFGKDFVLWIESLVTQWYIGGVAILGAVLFGFVYSMFMRTLGAKFKAAKEAEKKRRTDEDMKVIHTRRKLAEKELESSN